MTKRHLVGKHAPPAGTFPGIAVGVIAYRSGVASGKSAQQAQEKVQATEAACKAKGGVLHEGRCVASTPLDP